MKIKVFQINSDRDKNRVKFQGLEETEQYQQSSQIDSSLYDEVFSGNVDCKNLEDVYRLFNTKCPPLHRGHSLSVSDIVGTDDGFYFCDTVGFHMVDFSVQQTQKPDNLLKAVVVEPGKPAYIAEVENSLRGLQRAVLGTIEATYPFDDNAMIFSNDESKLNSMEGNRTINGELYAGPLIIVGDDGHGGNCSLTDEQLSKYTEQFKTPEAYTQEDVEDSIYMNFQSF